jgi:aryl-alcohol dehydrogenase-like predicted oxidoreductase
VVAWKAAILNQARLPPLCLLMSLFIKFWGVSFIWPACWHNTPICETMKTLEELVNKGLVRYIGLTSSPP